jgi:hypothetical protein
MRKMRERKKMTSTPSRMIVDPPLHLDLPRQKKLFPSKMIIEELSFLKGKKVYVTPQLFRVDYFTPKL